MVLVKQQKAVIRFSLGSSPMEGRNSQTEDDPSRSLQEALFIRNSQPPHYGSCLRKRQAGVREAVTSQCHGALICARTILPHARASDSKARKPREVSWGERRQERQASGSRETAHPRSTGMRGEGKTEGGERSVFSPSSPCRTPLLFLAPVCLLGA